MFDEYLATCDPRRRHKFDEEVGRIVQAFRDGIRPVIDKALLEYITRWKGQAFFDMMDQ